MTELIDFFYNNTDLDESYELSMSEKSSIEIMREVDSFLSDNLRMELGRDNVEFLLLQIEGVIKFYYG